MRVAGTWYGCLVPGTWYLIPGVLGGLYQVPGHCSDSINKVHLFLFPEWGLPGGQNVPTPCTSILQPSRGPQRPYKAKFPKVWVFRIFGSPSWKKVCPSSGRYDGPNKNYFHKLLPKTTSTPTSTTTSQNYFPKNNYFQQLLPKTTSKTTSQATS